MFCSLFALSACNDDDDAPVDETPQPSYFQTSVGSYWVYDTYSIDAAGTEILFAQGDTVFATGDTLVDGETYYKFYGKLHALTSIKHNALLRDSLGYILQLGKTGRYVMSYSNLDTVLSTFRHENSSLFHSLKMKRVTDVLELPSGTFSNVLDAELTTYRVSDSSVVGITNNYFGEGIGQLTKTIFYSGAFLGNQSYFEGRLVAYYIAP